jgi:hypothetical protein
MGNDGMTANFAVEVQQYILSSYIAGFAAAKWN